MPLLPTTITGNLTKDPWLKKLSSGNCLGILRVAASRRIRDENSPGGWRDVDNLYLNVECWGQLAFNLKKSLRKGMPVVVTGSLITHEWDDDKTGTKQQRIVLRAHHVGLDLNRFVIGSRKSEPTEHNVDGIPLPDMEGGEDFFDENQDSPAQPVGQEASNSYDRALATPPRTGGSGQAAQDDAPDRNPSPAGAGGESTGNTTADPEPTGVGAQQGGGPPF